jgi:hypothetical protein
MHMIAPSKPIVKLFMNHYTSEMKSPNKSFQRTGHTAARR